MGNIKEIVTVHHVTYRHGDMPKLTFAQAARAAGKSRQQISRLIENGKLSKEEGPTGGFVIDAAELLRVYPDADIKNAPVKAHGVSPGDEAASTKSTVHDGRVIELLTDERDRLRVELDNVRRDQVAERDRHGAEVGRLLGIVEAAQRQLTDQRTRPEPVAVPPPAMTSEAPRRRWWPF